MYSLYPASRFRKDVKRIKKRGYDLSLLKNVIRKLAAGEKLPESCRDHALAGSFSGYRECHVTADWLLICKIREEKRILYLTRTGSHGDLLE